MRFPLEFGDIGIHRTSGISAILIVSIGTSGQFVEVDKDVEEDLVRQLIRGDRAVPKGL